MVNIYTYNIRNRHNFLLNAQHLSLFEKKPSYKGAVFYKQLPEDLKRLPEKNLKRTLTNWLLDRSIYTTQEFLEWRNE
jgi:hypothetical protein